jgi:predicted lipid-binding transport protein (Tim44 family)
VQGTTGILVGAAVGGVVGLYGGGLIIGMLMGNGQAGMVAFYLVMPVGALLGALVGWLMTRTNAKSSEPGG